MNSMAPIVGVSLKMHLGYQETIDWLPQFRRLATASMERADLEAFALPSFVALAEAQRIFRDSGVGHGAQDAFWEMRGAYTGEVSPEVIRELGGRYVEVGHAERRRLFSEDDAILMRKTAAIVATGLVPVICVGETDKLGPDGAALACRRQLGPILDVVPEHARVIIAYEPVWAIGAAQPASPDHIRIVASGLREFAARPADKLSVIYGGSAGPGLFQDLIGAVDGLFLGRTALDPTRLGAVFDEVVGAQASNAR